MYLKKKKKLHTETLKVVALLSLFPGASVNESDTPELFFFKLWIVLRLCSKSTQLIKKSKVVKWFQKKMTK